MEDKTCILVCNYFAKEVKAVVQSLNLQNVHVKVFPSNCGRPALKKDEIQQLITSTNCKQHCVLGSTCLKDLKNDVNNTVNLCHFDTCFDMVLNKNLVNHYIKNGAYIVSPGWLNNWKHEMKNMGFNKEMASDFFKETCKEIILLDTGVGAENSENVKEFALFINMPFRIIPVGLDFMANYIGKTVLQLSTERKQLLAERKVNDYSMTMDLLNDLAETLNEKEVISKIIQLFTMLFAPAKLFYLEVNNGIHGNLIATPEIEKNDAVIEELLNSNETETITTLNTGFQCKLVQKGELLGIIKIDEIAFPQYREHYQNLAASLIQICALVVSNARAYQLITNQKDQLNETLHELRETQKMLVESEKMASLGNLVAGVAHELNTPVGIGITATSGFLNKVSELEALFNAGELTKSSFEKSLASMKMAGDLIFKNLQRTSELISSFKLVSVDEASERIREFNLKSYLNDILVSLGPQIKSKQIEVKMNCTENILIKSYPGALAQVFTNLIFNSINHAFKDVTNAGISIAALTSGGFVHINYSDNGKGIPEENLSKIFDPFFTTDKQEGSGLGLHIVYNIITQKLKGTISCESKPGDGVVFKIKIPIKLEELENR